MVRLGPRRFRRLHGSRLLGAEGSEYQRHRGFRQDLSFWRTPIAEYARQDLRAYSRWVSDYSNAIKGGR